MADVKVKIANLTNSIVKISHLTNQAIRISHFTTTFVKMTSVAAVVIRFRTTETGLDRETEDGQIRQLE